MAKKNQIQLTPKDDSMKGNIIRRNLVVFQQQDANLLQASKKLWQRKILTECDFNIYWSSDCQHITDRFSPVFPEGSFAQWQAAGFDRNSLVVDPLIIDPEKGNFKLMPQSPAFIIGFKPIPYQLIGIGGYQK